MSTEPANSDDWLTWLSTSVAGLFLPIGGYILNYFSREIRQLRVELREAQEKQGEALRSVQSDSKRETENLWQALENMREKLEQLVPRGEIDRLRQSLEEDRRLAAQDRADIAAKMVTRQELDRQLDQHFQRLIQALMPRN